MALLVLDTFALGGLVAGASATLERGAVAIAGATTAPPEAVRAVLIGVACACATPLIVGIGRLARRLARQLAVGALPRKAGSVDLDATPRRALEVTLQFAATLAAGVVAMLIAQPFLPTVSAPIVLGALLAALVVAVWRSAANLESHVQAGSQAVVEALRSFAYAGRTGETQRIIEIRSLLHGLGEPVAVRLGPETPSVGRTLAELDLRGRSGATVLAISRGTGSIVAPPASERLRAGDLLALAGSDEAIEAARKLLSERALRSASAQPRERAVEGPLRALADQVDLLLADRERRAQRDHVARGVDAAGVDEDPVLRAPRRPPCSVKLALAGNGSRVALSATSSTAHRSPRPRTSPTFGCASSAREPLAELLAHRRRARDQRLALHDLQHAVGRGAARGVRAVGEEHQLLRRRRRSAPPPPRSRRPPPIGA